jgi:hypothetical protein
MYDKWDTCATPARLCTAEYTSHSSSAEIAKRILYKATQLWPFPQNIYNIHAPIRLLLVSVFHLLNLKGFTLALPQVT